MWEEKKAIRQSAKPETHNELENEVFELQTFHKPTAGTINYREGHFKDNAKIRLEQNHDEVLRNFRAKIEGEPYEETEFTQDYRYKHYLQNIMRIEMKQDVLTRRYYNDTGIISHYQILLPKQLLDEFVHALHGHNANHRGIPKMIQEARQEHCYPCIAKYIRNRVTKCQMCIQNKRINNDLLKLQLLNCPDWDLGPEDILQTDILPNLPPSGGYDNIINAIDMFSRYLFAYPVTRITAPAVAKIIMDILCKHIYLPTIIITDMGTEFNSQVTKEVAAVLNIELKRATTKHAQTIGLLERTHASVKAHLKAATGEFRNNWHKFLPLAVLNHNTTYHATLGCEPTRVFHGRIPHNILDFKLGYNPNPRFQPQTEVAEEVQKRIALLHDQTKRNIMQSYLKYKAYYDRRAKASPLTTEDFWFILNPKADTQATKIFRWVNFVGSVPIKLQKSYRTINILFADRAQIKPNYFTALDYENTLHKLLLQIILPEKPTGRKRTHLSLKMTYMPMLGTVILALVHSILTTKTVINKKTQWNMNLFHNQK